jgi:ubiquinol oxidase
MVCYLKHETVRNYSHALADIDVGRCPDFLKFKLPLDIREYWDLAPEATFRDLLLFVRADEACHREVNRDFSVLA